MRLGWQAQRARGARDALVGSRATRRGAAARGAVVALAACTAAACAHFRPAPPEVASAARALPSYSATLRVSLRGADLRGRGRVLMAFTRPDALRVEVPGPGGLRLLAVARAGKLWAVFPGEAAWFEGPAEAEQMDALLGLALAPHEVIDLLLGHPPARLRGFRADWDTRLPRHIEATLPDGTHLSVKVDEVEAPASLPAAAFAEPRHDGYRRLDADEARSLWSRR